MSPRPKRAPLSRAAVVDAAVDLVAEAGAEALGINRLARTLGIKAPSLYNHVTGGDDLRVAVVVEGWRRLGERFAADTEGASPRAALLAIADRFRDFVLDQPALYQLMSRTTVPQGDPAFAEVEAEILGTFARALKPFGLVGDDAIHATRALRSATHGFVLLEASGQLALAQDPATSYRKMVEWMVDGLGGSACV